MNKKEKLHIVLKIFENSDYTRIFIMPECNPRKLRLFLTDLAKLLPNSEKEIESSIILFAVHVASLIDGTIDIKKTDLKTDIASLTIVKKNILKISKKYKVHRFLMKSDNPSEKLTEAEELIEDVISALRGRLKYFTSNHSTTRDAAIKNLDILFSRLLSKKKIKIEPLGEKIFNRQIKSLYNATSEKMIANVAAVIGASITEKIIRDRLKVMKKRPLKLTS
jgi:hypothetical protein